MYSGPILHTDTGNYCQNLKTLGIFDFLNIETPNFFCETLDNVKLNFKHSLFSLSLAVIALKCLFCPFLAKIARHPNKLSFQPKVAFKKITAHSEENRLCLKFNVTFWGSSYHPI